MGRTTALLALALALALAFALAFPATAFALATLDQLHSTEPEVAKVLDSPDAGNMRVARVIQTAGIITGSLLAVNLTVESNVDIRGDLRANQIKCRKFIGDVVKASYFKAAGGSIIVDGDLVLTNRKPRGAEKKREGGGDAASGSASGSASASASASASGSGSPSGSPPASGSASAGGASSASASGSAASAAPSASGSASDSGSASASAASASASGSASTSQPTPIPARFMSVEEAFLGDDETNGEIRANAFIAEDVILGGMKQWKLVRHDDFQDGAEGWSMLETSSCLSSRNKFLGGHCNIANGRASKVFENLPPHQQVRVTARYHFIDNWQGETAFLQLGDEYVWADRAQRAMPGQGLQMCGSPKYTETRMSLPVDVVQSHDASFLEVSFGSHGGPADQDPCERSFGVDDVMVYVR